MKKETLAMILAGGQGSRLGVLTNTIAKPAVLYGAKYRIIDFSLSNCINSGIDTVGILTQYQPLKLNSHIGIGKPWDMDRMDGGVTILSPYLKGEKGEWYLGTANAVYQNIDYIDKNDPSYIIILSGDHVYKMDYSKMLDFHRRNKADATISVIEVPINEASRYGIMNAHDNGKIHEFEEKPSNPKSNLASMGVYIFTWEVLREYLIKDNENGLSNHDFGKNVIPSMLGDGLSMWAYRFKGYWKDVGTIDAYWQSNMDLIQRVPEFNLYEPEWRIYTPNPVKHAHFVAGGATVKMSMIAEGCIIYGNVRNSVLFPGVYVDSNVAIEDSIIMSNSCIKAGSTIKKCIIGESVTVGNNVSIGEGEYIPNRHKPNVYNSGITVVGERALLPDDLVVGKNVMIDNLASRENFCSLVLESGGSVFKDGDCE